MTTDGPNTTELIETAAERRDRLASELAEAQAAYDGASRELSALKRRLGKPVPTREELVEICERAFTLEKHWHNRDSSAAHRQLGEAYALLKAGCDFVVTPDDQLLDTWWVTIWFKGFSYFEGDLDGHGPVEEKRFYLPTVERLDRRPGEDWY